MENPDINNPKSIYPRKHFLGFVNGLKIVKEYVASIHVAEKQHCRKAKIIKLATDAIKPMIEQCQYGLQRGKDYSAVCL